MYFWVSLPSARKARPDVHSTICIAVRYESLPGKEGSENRYGPELENVFPPDIAALVVDPENVAAASALLINK